MRGAGRVQSALGIFSIFFGAVVIAAGFAGDVGAGNKGWDGRSSRNYGNTSNFGREAARRQQAEMERQRREQERAQKSQARETQQVQQKPANMGSAGQWQQPRQQQMPEPGKNALSPSAAAAGPAVGAGGDPQAKAGPDGNGKSVEETSKETDDSDDDWTLNDAERRVRTIDRERNQDFAKAQRQHEELLRKERAREDRIRERAFRQRQLDPKPVNRLPPPEPTKQPTPIVPVAVEKPSRPAANDADPNKEPRRRPLEFFDAPPTRASHLGMGRNAGEGNPGPRAPSGEPEGAPPSVVTGAVPPVTIAVPAPASEALSGAVLPPVGAVVAPLGTLVVSGLSSVELAAAKAKGFTVGDDIDLKGAGTKVRRVSARGLTDAELERELHKMAPFSQALPNHEYSIFLGTIGESEDASRKVSPASSQPCPEKTCFGSQLIKWNSALASCTKNVKIGIIDTSFDVDHPAFKRLNPVQGEFLGDERPSGFDWHGTAVLALLAGDPHSGTPGLVPDATFLLATAFRSDAAGNATTDTLNLLRALDWLDQLDVDVVNMSFSGPKDPSLAKAIDRMSKKGVVFVAAAGNMGPTGSPSYPAAYPNVVAVTAVNRNGVGYKNANRGSYIDVAAPGVDILTALPDAKQGYRTGTSFAVPFVTAILAAEVGAIGQSGRRPADPLDYVPKQDLGPPGRDPIYGAGLALAPSRCGARSDAVAQGEPGAGAWSAGTTLFKAGAAFAP